MLQDAIIGTKPWLSVGGASECTLRTTLAAMHRTSKPATRSALRLARSAPTFGLGAVAEAAGCSLRRVESDLETASGRGRCAQQAAQRVLRHPGRGVRLELLGLFSRAVPPQAARLIAHRRYHTADMAHGTASWLARSPDEQRECPAVTLRRAAQGTAMRRFAAAQNPSCPQTLLTVFANDTVWRLRATAASNPSCPPQLLACLAADPKPEVRYGAAINRNCPRWVMARLAADPGAETRGAVAARSSCPPQTLDRLAGDDNDATRVNVAANPNAWPETLARLASDPLPRVRAAVAANTRCPDETLRLLTADDERVVASPASRGCRSSSVVRARFCGCRCDVRRDVHNRPLDHDPCPPWATVLAGWWDGGRVPHGLGLPVASERDAGSGPVFAAPSVTASRGRSGRFPSTVYSPGVSTGTTRTAERWKTR